MMTNDGKSTESKFMMHVSAIVIVIITGIENIK